MRPIFTLCLAALAVTACGERVDDEHFARDRRVERPENPPPATEAVPIRIGEMGANFAACSAAGTTRNLGEGERLPVRAAPFDSSAEAGAIASGARFHICTRSHDQRWMGVIYSDDGTIGGQCGVDAPVDARRAYDGPCRSGWVSSAFVRLVAG